METFNGNPRQWGMKFLPGIIFALSACEPIIVSNVKSDGGSTAPKPADICSDKVVSGVTGIADCSGGISLSPLNPTAGASQIVAGQKAYNDQGAQITGTATDHGDIDLNASAAAPSEGGFFSSLSLSLAETDVCTGKSIFGSTGSAACMALIDHRLREKTEQRRA